MSEDVVYDCLPEVMEKCPEHWLFHCSGRFGRLVSRCGDLNQEATRERARREAVLYGIGHQGNIARAE